MLKEIQFFKKKVYINFTYANFAFAYIVDPGTNMQGPPLPLVDSLGFMPTQKGILWNGQITNMNLG